MRSVKLNYQGVLNFISKDEINSYKEKTEEALQKLITKTGLGNEYLGWINYSNTITDEEIDRINQVSDKIKQNSDVLVVIGIGGSYLGAKAALSILRDYYPTQNGIEVIFFGNSFSSNYAYEVLRYLEHKEFSVNVISKSGTTTETAVAFRIIRSILHKKYGSKAKERIYVVTDEYKGALRKLANKEGYVSFSLPNDVGGRYSVLTSVGLLPMAVNGIDIKKVIQGAKDAQNYLINAPFWENDALLYAAIRNIFHQNYRKDIEVLASFEPNFTCFGEWWKQLFGESEGKHHKGLFPTTLVYSTDLHSIGQYIQDGKRNIIETIISFDKVKYDIPIPYEKDNLDELNYLSDFTLSKVNEIAREATIMAHIDGEVPVMEVQVAHLDEYTFGYLVYFFMLSAAVSGYLLGVNPFNQEGVEDYKRNMFALLNKPGYEELKRKLVARLYEKNNN